MKDISFFYNIKNYGAIGDGISNDTNAIKDAIAACKNNGGGTIYVPQGKYLTGPIDFVNNMNLYLDAGTVIYFSRDFKDYPPVFTRWEGVECFGFHPCIYGKDLENISITGHGIIDGQGEVWWEEFRKRRKEGRIKPELDIEKELARLNPGYDKAGSGGGGREMQFLRPPLIQFLNCKNITIDGVICRNSPFWNNHYVYCENVVVNNVKFINPYDAPNTDGLDIDSCRNIRITNSTFDVGDDCLCLKAGLDKDGIRVGKPTEIVTVTNCTMLHGHGGVVFGSDSSGGIRNAAISNCIFIGTDRGIRFKSRRGRGGIAENITFNNIVMKDVICPIVFNLFYKCGAGEGDDHLFAQEIQEVSETTPEIKNINISNIIATEVKGAAGFFYGLPERPLKNISLNNIKIEMKNPHADDGSDADMTRGIKFHKKTGFLCKFMEDAVFDNIKIQNQKGEKFFIEECRNVKVNE